MKLFAPTSLRRILLAASLACGVFAGATPAAEPTGFSGAVSDAVGNLLPDVEVLFIAPTSSSPAEPVAVAHTGVDGRFSVTELRSGAYQVAAIKRGYRTFIGQVHTDGGRWIRMVLHPQAVAAEEGSPLPEDRHWALRLPRRHILRELDAPLDDDAEIVSGVAGREPLRLQVDQLVQVATDLQRAPDEDPMLQGLETRLRVDGSLDGRGIVRARASHRRLTTSRFGVPGSAAVRERDHLASDFSYEPTGTDTVFGHASFFRGEARWSPRTRPGWDAYDHEEERWSAALGYRRDFGATSTLSASVGVAAGALSFPSDLPAGLDSPLLENRALRTRVVWAAGSADGHRVETRFDAARLELDGGGLRAAGVAELPGFDGREGWSAAVRATDEWRVLPSLWLVYGAGYLRDFGTVEAAWATPHVGAKIERPRFGLSWLATFFDPSSSAELPASAAGSIGLDAQFELPLGTDVRIIARMIDRPTLAAELEDPGERRRSGPAYVTDGHASRSEAGFTIEHARETLVLFADLASGRMEGRLAAVLPYELPFQELAERRLDYYNGRVGLRLVPQGTLVALELQTVDEEREGTDGESAGRQRLVELSLSQEILRSEELGHWRFLMALSLARLAAGDPSELRQVLSNDPLETTDGRLTAGLSLEF